MTAPNPLRGEAEIGGKRIVVDFNGLCALERKTGLTVTELLVKSELGLSFDELRTWISLFLAEPLLIEEVGNLIGAVGPAAAGEALGGALDGFFAPMNPAQGGDAEDGENPRVAGDGIGTPSSAAG